MTSLQIVMPVLNEGRTLGARLRALKSLRDRGARLVVVDGGSTDETWATAAAHADCAVLAPRGRGAQMNAGAREASAEVLLFLHADTALPVAADRWIEAALAGGSQWGRFDLRIDGGHPLLRVTERMISVRSRLTGVATGDQAMFVRREVFERLGGFADIPLMEDIELSSRLKRIGRPACIGETKVVTSGRRWLRNGVLRTILLMWRLRLAYFLGADPQGLADRYGYTSRPPVAPAAIAILAKAPVPGISKTRLVPRLGPAGAARAQRRFTLDTLRTARAAALGPVTLWGTPSARHRFFRAVHRRSGVEVRDQGGGNLGERLARAMRQHFMDYPQLALLIVGTDCPVLSPGLLHEAARSLAQFDAVLVPAEDGGYVLIGLRRPLPHVFDRIAWSTDVVAAQTRERLRESGASWRELSPLWDVDEPADWDRLQRLLQVAPEQGS